MSEQEEYHSTDWKTMRKNIAAMRPYVRSFRRYTVPMLITGVLVSAIDAVYPLFRQYILDHYIGQQTLDTLPQFIALYLVVLVAQVIMNFISTYYCGRVEMGVDQKLRDASFDHVQQLSFSYFNQNNVGYIHSAIFMRAS